MDKKKKGPAPQAVLPDDEVLKAVRELPQTMRSRFCLKLKLVTIEEALTRCLLSVASERGVSVAITDNDKSMIGQITKSLENPGERIGFVFSGPFKSGKTTLMLTIERLFNVVGKYTDAWEYQSENSLDTLFLRANELRRYETVAMDASVLFLDNLGYEENGRDGAYSVEAVKNLLHYRSDNRLLTVIGTPYDSQSIQETYGVDLGNILATEYFWCKLPKHRPKTDRL